MPQESYIARTKDNLVVVFTIEYANDAEKSRKELLCRSSCENMTLREFNNDRNAHLYDHNPAYDAMDVHNTEFINDEVVGYHYRRNRDAYENGLLNNNYPAAANRPNTIHFDSRIDDAMVPEVIKNIGLKIVPVDEVYNVTYNPVTRDYDIQDDHGQGFRRRVATVKHGENKMEVVRNHFTFAPEDYNRITFLISEFEGQQQQNPQLTLGYFISHLRDRRDNALMNVYNQAYNPTNEKETTILHELKHIKNAIFASGLELKKDAKRLSVEDMYRIKYEDERSAYFNEWVDGINKYLQRGNMSDYSMFDSGAQTIVANLSRMRTDAEKMAYVTDYGRLMRDFEGWFETNKRDYYDRNQFRNNLANAVSKMSLSAESDSQRTEYNRLRSLYFHYEVFNPQTRRMEFKNLSQYMPEVTIPQEIRTSTIEPNEEALRNRMRRYNQQVNSGEINPSLVPIAKKVMREGIVGQSCVNEVDDIQIATFYDEGNTPPSGGNTPPDNGGNTPPSGGNTPPDNGGNTPPDNGGNTPPNGGNTPPHVPDDQAGWSDDLKAYWSTVAGYREIAKNNDEYRFKIHEATVRYENRRRVQVSANAPYDLYVKMLHAPSSSNKPVEFLSSLSREQALTLYVACINNGRAVRGHVPTDLRGIENIPGIPQAALNRFRHLTAGNNPNNTTSRVAPPAPSTSRTVDRSMQSKVLEARRNLVR
ncbi:MAG: hypothetical protein J6Y91_03680 [Alphaproteobacteria bacterium]|nr:hypothetical protein [Alphaproteobacteria bacterium]